METLSADGGVSRLSAGAVGTVLTLVSQEGNQVVLQDAQGVHYRIALAATDFQPPATSTPAPSAVATAPVAQVAQPPPVEPVVVPAPAASARPETPMATAAPTGNEPLTVTIGSRKTGGEMSVWPPGGLAGQPLLISAHGHGGAGPKEIRGWMALAKSHHFTIVCPTFMSSANAKFLADDDPYFTDCLTWIQSNLQYDKERVFMAGFSGGGFPTWYLASKRPDFFHGLFLQSGNFAGDYFKLDLSRWKEKPIKIIWGSADLADIPVQGTKALEYLKAHGCHDVTTEVVAGAHHQEHPDMVVQWIESGQPAPDAAAR